LALSCNHCYGGNTISVTYAERVFVAFGIQSAMRMRHTVICGLPGSTIIFHSTSTARFSKNKKLGYQTQFFFSATFVQNNFHYKKKWARYNQKCTLTLKEEKIFRAFSSVVRQMPGYN